MSFRHGLPSAHAQHQFTACVLSHTAAVRLCLRPPLPVCSVYRKDIAVLQLQTVRSCACFKSSRLPLLLRMSCSLLPMLHVVPTVAPLASLCADAPTGPCSSVSYDAPSGSLLLSSRGDGCKHTVLRSGPSGTWNVTKVLGGHRAKVTLSRSCIFSTPSSVHVASGDEVTRSVWLWPVVVDAPDSEVPVSPIQLDAHADYVLDVRVWSSNTSTLLCSVSDKAVQLYCLTTDRY